MRYPIGSPTPHFAGDAASGRSDVLSEVCDPDPRRSGAVPACLPSGVVGRALACAPLPKLRITTASPMPVLRSREGDMRVRLGAARRPPANGVTCRVEVAVVVGFARSW